MVLRLWQNKLVLAALAGDLKNARSAAPPLPLNLASVAGKAAVAIVTGIATKLGNHSFRATGITAYLRNGGTPEKAAAMAKHASTLTTHLYDRRRDDVSLTAEHGIARTQGA
jgi:integrase